MVWGNSAFAGLVVAGFLLAGLLLRGRYPHIPIWSIMMAAMFLSLLTGLVGVDEAVGFVDFDVVFFLVGMFALVGLAESSGLLNYIAVTALSYFGNTVSMVVGSSLVFGLMAAFFLNDTVALMGPAIAVLVGKAIGNKYEASFMLLLHAITVGSVMTPVGNPQNLMIAIQSGMQAPFIAFLAKLAVPTVISLVVLGLYIVKVYGVEKRPVTAVALPAEAIVSRKDAYIAALGISVSAGAILVNDAFAALGLPHVSSRGLIPFIVAAAVWPFVSSPRDVLSRVDLGTILFFVAMFVTMEGVWRSGLLQMVLSHAGGVGFNGFGGILLTMTASLGFSQILSNVPFTKLFIQYMRENGVTGADENLWLSLATYSTIAGSLTILGAASNIIVLEVLERRYQLTISFWRFMKIGVPVVAFTSVIYLPFLLL
ncbi:MAG: SLC13 family permease [Candidatus Caldarchaeum sp.]|nr:SLC13 family permease [Candidatus Caldarchaeum sp.]